MANYNDLITAIDSVIKTNNRREITGQLLQNVLNTMVGSLGENYQLAGFATPTTNPHQPDQNVFYVASQAGVYTQFDNIVLGDGISFLMWKNGAWTSQTIANVTQSWVQQNFVSKEWFRKVFRVYDEDGLEIVPNDMDSVVDNIKAMVGLWTNEYLSALGMGRDGGGTTQTLAQLNDVQLGTLENGDALVYNTAIHKWENKQIQTGVDMSVVWAALAANTNEQINASHLATALSSYVTSANLSTMLNDYATKAWAGQNFITVEWFDKLFQLYNGTEAEANKIAPNGALPIDQTQLNIEAMFGFWTKKYISSLGQGDDGSAGSGDVTWELLASQATDGRTIHSSYIAAALAGYATQNWVQQQGYITSAQLSALEYLQTITGGDEVVTFTTNKGTETILDLSHEHSWFELLDKPDTIAGLGVALSASDIPNIDWSKITTGKPSTLAGYGITDAVAFVAIGGVNYSPVSGVVTLPVYTSTQVDALARLKTLALSDDGVLSFTHQDDSTTLVDFTHEHSFLELLDRPETIKGYGITIVASDIPNLDWSKITTGKPNTLAGYGITDAKIVDGVITLGASNITPVTSVAMSVPTGFSVSGSPISKTGTLAVSYASGYEGFTTELKNKINTLFSWFEVDNDGNIKTKDYTDGGTTKHRGFYSPSFISALGQGDDGTAGTGDVTWALLATQATDGRTIHLSYISAALASYLSANNYLQSSAIADMATQTWVGQQGYLTSSSLSNYYTKTEVDALPRIKAIALGSDGCLSFTWQDNTSIIADYSHEHSWFELLDRPDTLAGFGITDAVKQVYIGNTAYSPTNGIITLPAYPTVPTNVSAFTNDAGYATQTWVGQQGYLTSHQPLNYINWLGNETAMSGTSRFDWTGLRLYGVYNNGYPTTYGNVIRVKGYGSGELLLGWNGDNTTNHLYYHSQRDTEGSYWGDWVTIIDSSNIGSQSVSYASSAGSAGYATSAGNADTVDGYHESAFLHLSGGSMSGKLGLMSNAYDGRNGSYGLNCNNSDIVGLNALWMADESDDWTEGIHYYRGDTGGWDSLRAYRGSWYMYANNGNSYGTLYVGNLYSSGAVSALSDIRHKEIVRNTNLQVEQIAAMRSVIYRKKDSNDNTLYAGSIAQDWQSILPQVVSVADNDEHTQSLQYGVAALIAVITTARKVAEHERRIADLERENERLKEIINNLNVA